MGLCPVFVALCAVLIAAQDAPVPLPSATPTPIPEAAAAVKVSTEGGSDAPAAAVESVLPPEPSSVAAPSASQSVTPTPADAAAPEGQSASSRRELSHTSATAGTERGGNGANAGFNVNDEMDPQPAEPAANFPVVWNEAGHTAADRHLPGPFADLGSNADKLVSHLPNSIYATAGYDGTTGMLSSTGLKYVPSASTGHGYTAVGEAQKTTTTSKLPPEICNRWILPPEAYKPQTPNTNPKYRTHSGSDYDMRHPDNNPESGANTYSPSSGPFPASSDSDRNFYFDERVPPAAVYKVDANQAAKDEAWGAVNLPSSVFGCGYCVCGGCKTPARNVTEYVPLSPSPTLDANGVPRHGLFADGIVNYTDHDDAMFPKWYTIQQELISLGTGDWDSVGQNWNGPLTNGEDPTPPPKDSAPEVFDLPWITNPLDTCRCPRWDACNKIAWTKTQKYCSAHSDYTQRGTWVWIATDCACDAAYTCTTPTVDGSPGDTCSPAKCERDGLPPDGFSWNFKGCYKSLAFHADQFDDLLLLSDLQKQTLDATAIGSAISVADISLGASAVSLPTGVTTLDGAGGLCAQEPLCVPEESNDINVHLTTRGLVASRAPVPPCVLGKDTNGKQVVEVNTQWFEVREIVAATVVTG